MPPDVLIRRSLLVDAGSLLDPPSGCPLDLFSGYRAGPLRAGQGRYRVFPWGEQAAPVSPAPRSRTVDYVPDVPFRLSNLPRRRFRTPTTPAQMQQFLGQLQQLFAGFRRRLGRSTGSSPQQGRASPPLTGTGPGRLSRRAGPAGFGLPRYRPAPDWECLGWELPGTPRC